MKARPEHRAGLRIADLATGRAIDDRAIPRLLRDLAHCGLEAALRRQPVRAPIAALDGLDRFADRTEIAGSRRRRADAYLRRSVLLSAPDLAPTPIEVLIADRLRPRSILARVLARLGLDRDEASSALLSGPTMLAALARVGWSDVRFQASCLTLLQSVMARSVVFYPDSPALEMVSPGPLWIAAAHATLGAAAVREDARAAARRESLGAVFIACAGREPAPTAMDRWVLEELRRATADWPQAASRALARYLDSVGPDDPAMPDGPAEGGTSGSAQQEPSVPRGRAFVSTSTRFKDIVPRLLARRD